ncbi:unnamed protein product, partial [Closterium sp. NIES-53]
RVRGHGHERYFLLVVDDYSRYTTVVPLRSKSEVTEVLIYWIRSARRQLSERFGSDLHVLRLHSDRGGEFSSDLLRAFCRAEGIRQTFTLPASPQQNGIAEHRLDMVMDVARTSAFRVWGSRAFVRDTSADKLSSRAVPSVFLGFPPDAPGWAFCRAEGIRQTFTLPASPQQNGIAEHRLDMFYHPTSRRVLSSQDVTFDESVSYIRLFPYRTASPPPPPPPLFLAPDPAEPDEVAVESGAAGAGAAGGAAGARAAGGATGAAGAGIAGTGAAGAGAAEGAAGAGAAGGAAGAGAAGGAAGAGAAGATGLGGARTGGTRAAGAGGVAGGGATGTGAGGDARPRSYYVPLLQQVLGPTPPLLSPPPPESHPVSPESRHASPEFCYESQVRAVRAGRLVSRPHPPPVHGTHSMILRPSTAPQRVPLPSPPASSLPDGPDPESDSLRAASPTVTRFLATAVTDPLFESTTASALVAELVDFAAPSRLVLLLKVIEGPYSSQWQAAMDAEMASWKSTGTYDNEVPPPGVNIVSGMWIFRVKRPPGSPPAFKAHYVAPGFSQRQGVDFFQTFSPTPKMTTLRVLLHVAAQRDYELHSLDFSTAFLQGSLHKEIWLRSPPGFTGSFPAGTQWSLQRPVYGLHQAPHDLVLATADTEALAQVKSELQKRHTCTDLGELTSYLGLRITRDRAQRTITLTHSHMVQQVLQRFGFTYSSPQSTPLPIGHSLSAPPSDESVEPSGLYLELVGSVMFLMTCTRPDLAYPLSLLARYVAPGRHRKVYWDAAKRVLRYFCNVSGMGLVLGGRARVVLTGHADASWVDDLATQQSSQGYTFSLGSGSVSWRSTRSSSVLSLSCEAEIYAGAMAAQELRWLTYLLTNLGEAPCSPPVLYVNNKAMIALCEEHRLEHRMKHIALCYFLARELQQRGQLRLAYVASQANNADVFTKALQPFDHQRFCVVLACFAFLDWSCDLLFSPTLPMGVCQTYMTV